MHATPISFCDTVAFNVRSDDDKKRVLDQMERNFGVRLLRRHNEMLTPELASVVDRNPYAAAFRTHGNPYYLCLTRVASSGGVPHVLFVDKKIQQGYNYPRMVLGRFSFGAHLFEGGTLMDGEMVRRSDGSWVFLVADLLGLSGTSLAKDDLGQRMVALHGLLENDFCPDVADVCALQVKRYFPAAAQRVKAELVNVAPHLGYAIRGIVYKPMRASLKDVTLTLAQALQMQLFPQGVSSSESPGSYGSSGSYTDTTNSTNPTTSTNSTNSTNPTNPTNPTNSARLPGADSLESPPPASAATALKAPAGVAAAGGNGRAAFNKIKDFQVRAETRNDFQAAETTTDADYWRRDSMTLQSNSSPNSYPNPSLRRPSNALQGSTLNPKSSSAFSDPPVAFNPDGVESEFGALSQALSQGKSRSLSANRFPSSFNAIPQQEQREERVSGDSRDQRDRVFLVRRGPLPDIYELYASAADMVRRVFQDALVPNLALSRMLRERFMNVSLTELVPMRCAWHVRFRKWVPFEDPRPQDELPPGARRTAGAFGARFDGVSRDLTVVDASVGNDDAHASMQGRADKPNRLDRVYRNHIEMRQGGSVLCESVA